MERDSNVSVRLYIWRVGRPTALQGGKKMSKLPSKGFHWGTSLHRHSLMEMENAGDWNHKNAIARKPSKSREYGGGNESVPLHSVQT